MFENNNGKLNPIKGSDNVDMLTLKPSIDINQAVNVVPTFAPMITPMELTRSNTPAFTKLTTITVVADELWIIIVINKPVITPFTRLDVMAVRKFRILCPATFCKASLIIFMPKRNTPNEPRSCRKSRIE